MPPRRTFAIRLVLLCAALCCGVLPGCLGDDGEDAESQPIHGGVLKLYASLPSDGPSATIARAVAAGQRQALADAGGRAGRFRVRLVRMSSSRPGSGNWDPGQVSENAARAARDPRTVAYLGELNLGASAVSVPVTNDAGILQVSPGDGLTSLTDEAPQSAAGPERYYPSGRRSFLRLVPEDLQQARLIVDRLQALGVERPALVVGLGVYARELAGELIEEAREAGLPRMETEDLRDDPGRVEDVATDLAQAAPDGIVLAVQRDRSTAGLLAAVARTLPRAWLLTGSGVLVSQPLVAAASASPAAVEAVAPELPGGSGTPAARRLLARIARRQGPDGAGRPALWGYESVRLVLDAIRATERGGGPTRRADVVREALAPRLRRSPIGTYRVLGSGAVQGLPLGLYRLEGDRFELVRTLR